MSSTVSPLGTGYRTRNDYTLHGNLESSSGVPSPSRREVVETWVWSPIPLDRGGRDRYCHWSVDQGSGPPVPRKVKNQNISETIKQSGRIEWLRLHVSPLRKYSVCVLR